MIFIRFPIVMVAHFAVRLLHELLWFIRMRNSSIRLLLWMDKVYAWGLRGVKNGRSDSKAAV
jgi:hypothetical protein